VTPVWRIGFCDNPAPPPAQLLLSLGFGSTLGNGRWHSRGRLQVVYAGSSRALCQLEKRVHCNGATPKAQALMRLEIDSDATLLDAADWGLQADWRHNEASTQSLGMQWLTSGVSLGLWVPSYVEPSERNLLLNPAHPQYPGISLVLERQPFVFDPRLFASAAGAGETISQP
jgi:RES domain-containing protein